MATLFSTPQKRASFEANKAFPAGLDRLRCECNRRLGVWRANSGTTFRQGMAVGLNSTGEVVVFDAANGTTLLGVAAMNKMSLGRSVVTDQSITFGVDNATKNLAHSGLVSGSVVVRSATGGTGTTYTVTTDYTVSLTNGTITHVAAGAIDETLPVYVSFAWSLTEQDYDFQGKNFWQQNDDVSIQDLRVSVIEAPAQVFTTEYDPSVVYALTGANSNIYANASGLFTSASASAKLCGKVINIPSAADPYLGIEFIGQVAANT